jgi:hypothetical protein
MSCPEHAVPSDLAGHPKVAGTQCCACPPWKFDFSWTFDQSFPGCCQTYEFPPPGGHNSFDECADCEDIGAPDPPPAGQSWDDGTYSVSYSSDTCTMHNYGNALGNWPQLVGADCLYGFLPEFGGVSLSCSADGYGVDSCGDEFEDLFTGGLTGGHLCYAVRYVEADDNWLMYFLDYTCEYTGFDPEVFAWGQDPRGFYSWTKNYDDLDEGESGCDGIAVYNLTISIVEA